MNQNRRLALCFDARQEKAIEAIRSVSRDLYQNRSGIGGGAFGSGPIDFPHAQLTFYYTPPTSFGDSHLSLSCAKDMVKINSSQTVSELRYQLAKAVLTLDQFRVHVECNSFVQAGRSSSRYEYAEAAQLVDALLDDPRKRLADFGLGGAVRRCISSQCLWVRDL